MNKECRVPGMKEQQGVSPEEVLCSPGLIVKARPGKCFGMYIIVFATSSLHPFSSSV